MQFDIPAPQPLSDPEPALKPALALVPDEFGASVGAELPELSDGPSIDWQIDITEAAGAEHRTFGWGTAEVDRVWTGARRCGLRLPALPAGPVEIELRATPWICPPMVTRQVLRISHAGRELGRAALSETQAIRVRLDPVARPPNEVLDLELDLPGFARDALVGGGWNMAVRGVALHGIRIIRAGAVAPAIAAPNDAAPDSAATGGVPSSDAVVATFGRDRNGLARVGIGWHVDEDGTTWSDAKFCTVELPRPGGAGPWQLRVALVPLRVPPLVMTQRLTLTVGGIVVGQFHFEAETAVVVPLPPEALAGTDAVEIGFALPDAFDLARFGLRGDRGAAAIALDLVAVEPAEAPPALLDAIRDDELDTVTPLSTSAAWAAVSVEALPEAIAAETGVVLAKLLKLFESLGDNCAFGLVQRKAGIEVLGLLRFVNISNRNLLAGLADEFRAVTDAENLGVDFLPGLPREIAVTVGAYEMRTHTFRFEDTADPQTVLAENMTKLGFLHRKFMETLRSGRKVFVCARVAARVGYGLVEAPKVGHMRLTLPQPATLAEIVPIWQALQRFGANTLLFVAQARDGRPAGSVEVLVPGLLRGWVAKLDITDRDDEVNHGDWWRVAANVQRLLTQPATHAGIPR